MTLQEDLVYRPKTKETRAYYEQLLNLVQKHLGDISTNDLKSAADEVIAILKTENMNDKERKREVEGILDRMADDTFNQMVVLAQQLVDYNPQEEYQGEQREEIIDVNVELDEEEEEDNDGQELPGDDQER